MTCIYCGGKTGVTNSRPQKRSNHVWRRRQCLRCKAVFTTHEAIDLGSALLVSRNKTPEPFYEHLLYAEVLLALKGYKDRYSAAREITSTIIKELLKLPQEPIYTPKQISLAAGVVLSRLNKQAYLRYVAEHPSLQR